MEKIKNIFRDGNQRFKVITNNYSLNEVLVVAIEVGNILFQSSLLPECL